MPRFFFDTDDGERIVRDDTGVSLSGAERAKSEALMLMRDFLYGVPVTGKTILGCVVRAQDGTPIHRLMMTIEGEDGVQALDPNREAHSSVTRSHGMF